MDRLTRFQANAGIALCLLVVAGMARRPEPAVAAGILLALAAFDLPPTALLAAAWLGLARLLRRVVSPVALFGLYFVFFVPYAYCFRLLNRRAVDRHFGRECDSLWVERPEGKRTTNFTEPW